MKVTAVLSSGSSGSAWSTEGRLSAILEFFGHNQPGRTKRARSCTATLNSRYGGPGRFLWSAWDSVGGKSVVPRIEAAVHNAETQLQRALDAGGVSY